MSAQKLKIHFIGIGGIGVSALAKYYLAKGCYVSGSDLVSSEITNALKKLSAKIYIGKHNAKNLSTSPGLVIYSPAIQKNNPELKFVLNQHPRLIKQPRVLSYPEALGELTKKHFTIAVSGTHGKSTTTAMIGLLLVKAGFDPTVIVGTKLKEFGNSNCRVGKSKYLVIEADEHFASFLNYWPRIIVLTNVEKEHLDYYKNLDNVLKAYKEYIAHLPKVGVLVANRDDENIIKMLSSKFKVQSSKLLQIAGGTLPAIRDRQFKIKNYSLKGLATKEIKKILKIPGEHNVSNALATLAVARILKIPDKISLKALSEYKGSWRRFEEKHAYLCESERESARITVISDYGHHPTEIRATLLAAREKYPKKKIWLIYQPHQYQRTYYLFKDFVRVFKEAPADKIIITDIFDVAGREEKEIKKKVSSEELAKAVKKDSTIYLPKNKIIGYLNKNLRAGEVVIIMGAGDIYQLVEKF